MVCWALLLLSFGAEQICHTRWPIEIFAHACVDVTLISTSFARIHMRSCQTPMALFLGLVVCWALLLSSFRAQRIVHTRWPTEIFAHVSVEVQSLSVPLCASLPATKHRKLPRPLQFEEQSTVATYFTGAVSSDVVHLIVLCWALVFRRSSPV